MLSVLDMQHVGITCDLNFIRHEERKALIAWNLVFVPDQSEYGTNTFMANSRTCHTLRTS